MSPFHDLSNFALILISVGHRAVVIEQLLPFSFFFQQEKQGRQETFSNFGKLIEGKRFGRLRIPVFRGKKYGKYGNTKNLGKKSFGSLDEKSFDRTALTVDGGWSSLTIVRITTQVLLLKV